MQNYISQHVLRVLIVFTAAANAERPDIVAHSQLAFDQLQQAISNTGVSAQSMSVELAGIQATTETETGNSLVDIGTFNANLTGVRTANDADIVMVMTGNLYDGVAGRASTVQVNSALYTAFVEHGDAINAKTFAHEFAHVAGARHEDDFTANDFEKGIVFSTGTWPFMKRRGTIMATRAGITTRPDVDGGERRITQYSNISKQYKGTLTGGPNNNNFLWFQENGPTVAAFIPNPDDQLSAQIVPPSSLCPCNSPYMSSRVTCPTGRVRYLWEVTTDFTNYTTISTNSSFSLNLPCSQSSFRGFRLTVTDDNTSITSSYFNNFSSDDCTNDFPFAQQSANEDITLRAKQGLQPIASPNPVSLRQAGNIKVICEGVPATTFKDNFKVEVVNSGHIVSIDNTEFSIFFNENQLSLVLKINSLSAGANTILIRNMITGEIVTTRIIALD